MSLTVIEDRSGQTGYVPRGAALELWRCRAPEVMVAGPAETGKTLACCSKLHALLLRYPGAQAVMARKVRDTIYGSVLQTFMRKVLRPDGSGGFAGVKVYGGERPQWFDYPGGGRLWLAGLDDPGKALSTERDFVYCNQAEELQLDDWQVLTTRATGRAGNAPYGQVMGDCNPGAPHHWIKGRGSLTVLESRHEDNPMLWDADKKEWTEQGRRTLAVLDALTGVRKQRLRHGRWVSAEGTVYELDPRVHVVDRFVPPASWTRFRSVDFGFTNPFVCQWWALDGDERMYLYREIYMTGRTVKVHRKQINDLSAGERIEATVADHDSSDRATLAESEPGNPGIHTLPAEKAISRGIQAVEDRLKVQPDGKPRLFLMRGSLVERDEDLAERKLPVCTEQEFDVYSWPKGSDGKPVKEVPVDKDNHGADGCRYGVAYANRRASSPIPRPAAGPTTILPMPRC